MEKSTLHIQIAADNALVVNGLRHRLASTFGSEVCISCSYDLRTLLRNIDVSTEVAVIDYFFDGISGEELRRKIRSVNPDSTVLLYSSAEDIIDSLQSILHGGTVPLTKKFSHKLVNQFY